MAEFIPRKLQNELERVSKLFPVIVVTGPRQSGKTTLCRKQFPDFHYANLEDIALREQIETAPKAFLQQYREGLIIDEVQNTPSLLSYVQVFADENPEAKIILTGSGNFSLLQNVSQSLAGRAAILNLLPLSLTEMPFALDQDTDKLLLKGGYPAVWSKGIPAMDVYKNYYNTYIERDIRQLLKIRQIQLFQTFIRLCAGRTASLLNFSHLSNEVGVSVPTIKEWISLLETSYVLFRLPPFYANIGKRLIKSPKLYFYDTGLVCFLLGIETEEQLQSHPLRGAVFENMIVLEFMKNRIHSGKIPHLYFYRDKSQIEVDLLEEKVTSLFAYEIKSAKRFTKDFTKNLNYLRRIFPDKIKSTQIIYDGEESIFTAENGMINFRKVDYNS